MDFKKLVLDDFCLRQFKKGSFGFINFTPEDFLNKVNENYNPKNLKDGYAPFCKHLYIENFTDSFSYYQKITNDNEHLIKTIYERRTEKELPVLKRFFLKDDIKLEKAKYLDIILYSKEQILKEKEILNESDRNEGVDYNWGIISVKSQNLGHEIPMDPITIMRNGLGMEYGGSGIKIDTEKYEESVKFWSENVIIK